MIPNYDTIITITKWKLNFTDCLQLGVDEGTTYNAGVFVLDARAKAFATRSCARILSNSIRVRALARVEYKRALSLMCVTCTTCAEKPGKNRWAMHCVSAKFPTTEKRCGTH
uniref:Uncharacterized protein n=1 Tax=Romanomermis culicivorax TaxID=13658 RepID=A0A915I3X7_ROMCU